MTFAATSDKQQSLSPPELEVWVEASVAFQDGFPYSAEFLPIVVKRLFEHDAKMAAALHSNLSRSIGSHFSVLGPALMRATTYSGTSNADIVAQMTFSAWTHVTSPNKGRVHSRAIRSQLGAKEEHLRFNFLTGRFLIDGEALGRLPADYQDSPDVRELFGNRHFLVYPSASAGMSYRLRSAYEGHAIHFGKRGSDIIVRAEFQSALMGFIPRHVFQSHNREGYDIPNELFDCAYWLNLRTGEMEFRQLPDIWTTKPRNWQLSTQTWQIRSGGSMLICPTSRISQIMHGVLQDFEAPERMTVYLSSHRQLWVRLRELELSFLVNPTGILQCIELNAEVDTSQDIVALYGCSSTLVVRDIGTGKRDVLVPVGDIFSELDGIHIRTRTCGNAFGYAKYEVDDILGRLHCPPDSCLLYTKAFLHAMTSFLIPDPLTGMTGTEEAINVLTSGAAQPWSPLSEGSSSLLRTIADLAPKREYYPKDKRTLQITTWRADLTPHIQHDGFDKITQAILARSSSLTAFSLCNEGLLRIVALPHLRLRAELCRCLYERHSALTDEIQHARVVDLEYVSRDRETGQSESAIVFKVTRNVSMRSFIVPSAPKYKDILTRWPSIGGFAVKCESLKKSLSSVLSCSISELWGEIINFCSTSDQVQVSFMLGVLAYSPSCNDQILQVLTAYSCLPSLRAVPRPEYVEYVGYRTDNRPKRGELLHLFIATSQPLFDNPGTMQKARRRAREQHDRRCYVEAGQHTDNLLSQWPVSTPQLTSGVLIDTAKALRAVIPVWRRCLQNRDLGTYADQAQSILNSHEAAVALSSPQYFSGTSPMFHGNQVSTIGTWPISLLHIASKSEPNGAYHYVQLPECEASSAVPERNLQEDPASTLDFDRLQQVLQTFGTSTSHLRRQYADDLLSSLIAPRSSSQSTDRSGFPMLNVTEVTQALNIPKGLVVAEFGDVKRLIQGNNPSFAWLQRSALGPAVTITELLKLLNSKRQTVGIQERLIALALGLCQVQRLSRLRAACLKNNAAAIQGELANKRHENWSPVLLPEWLLIELECNMLIRPNQVTVAQAIVNPPSGRNSVCQLNMGQGKTSCIVPMALALIANGSNLARLLVPRALVVQTALTLQSRLGGLAGRQISHLVYTRRTPASTKFHDFYKEELERMLASGGIVLTSPENVLSFKLNGWQLLSDGRLAEGHRLLRLHQWIHEQSRDVIDESDFALGVKTQLIYPSGAQASVDGSPWRWEVAEKLLQLVHDHIGKVHQKFPQSVAIVDRKPGFPIIGFTRPEPQDELQQRIVEDICHGRTTLIRFPKKLTSHQQSQLRAILSSQTLDEFAFRDIVATTRDKVAAPKVLLTTRGLLVNGILLLCLRKRWNVTYALALQRCPVAVPYNAKGVPSLHAEFGHPDVAIVLTSLSFYYQGLDHDQFRDGLRKVLRSDDPAAEFQRWTGTTALPASLSQWSMINMDDAVQFNELWRRLRPEKASINYHLNNAVFPAHAKQFPVKLQASAWDLPLTNKSYGFVEGKQARTNGFSGTNDNKVMLPATITQDDLPSLQHTNAEVLSYLLQERNLHYQVASIDGARANEIQLLEMLCEQGIRLLIDAGAYILEMDNQALAASWLMVDARAKAAIYFRSHHTIWVKYRNKAGDLPLVATPFAEDLSECVVYLDEAHTRGVDLKFPATTRGGLTLSVGQTKDHTVQAAMRLRQLATTQSITFFAPPDVHQSVIDLCQPFNGNVDSDHVVRWLLEQTCKSNEDLLGLHFSQGIEFCRRADAEWKYDMINGTTNHREGILRELRLPESRTLAEMYASDISGAKHGATTIQSLFLRNHLHQIYARQRLVGGKGNTQSALEEVEQEREEELQVEEVREIQMAAVYKPLRFGGLDKALESFAETGVLDGSAGFRTFSQMLVATKTGTRHGVQSTPSRLFVSKEFPRTVMVKSFKGIGDDYVRPVEWVLWSPSSDSAVVIVPEEAEALMPALMRPGSCSTYLLCYAAPVTKSMRQFSTLQYYTIPSLPTNFQVPEWLAIEVGILAGRMYFESKELRGIRKYLEEGIALEEDGISTPLSPNVEGFLMEWLALRRNTRDVLHTAMGYVCLGRELVEDHSFFVEGV
ncbi:Fatty acid synthase subunit beta [Elsinoe australis]|uniref:ubiquitinyl hydrolase 1 n=1 Tax=Elsinoe australis TaxID=40998 RepID=A0A2P7ZJM4_9PEZI|nr:Fatty acid synthase subunit beta [Elsinoe australis]